MTDFEQSIVSGLKSAMKRLQADLRTELKAQGHYLTGRLHDSIEYEISAESLPAGCICSLWKSEATC